MGAPFTKAIHDAIEAYGKVLNYSFYGFDANLDYDAYINELESLCDQKYDGIVAGTDDALTMRVYEICKENDVALVAESTAFLDSSGKCIQPSVAQDQYANGEACVEWLAANYTKYWKDPID
jgi:ABC-type sugar transport system substrate-binding protein